MEFPTTVEGWLVVIGFIGAIVGWFMRLERRISKFITREEHEKIGVTLNQISSDVRSVAEATEHMKGQIDTNGHTLDTLRSNVEVQGRELSQVIGQYDTMSKVVDTFVSNVTRTQEERAKHRRTK